MHVKHTRNCKNFKTTAEQSDKGCGMNQTHTKLTIKQLRHIKKNFQL